MCKIQVPVVTFRCHKCIIAGQQYFIEGLHWEEGLGMTQQDPVHTGGAELIPSSY